MNYIIITPVKNEEKYIKITLDSVVKQTLLPKEWIIVNDFSTDKTVQIIKEYEKKYSWIKLVNCPFLKEKDYSSRVVLLFNYGLSKTSIGYDIILKLDGDVSFEKNFINNIVEEFKNNKFLGIASGTVIVNGKPERSFPKFEHTRGATKFYLKKCFQAIGGIVPIISWDTVDNAAARAKGWEAKALPYYFKHNKIEGSRVGSKLYQNYRIGISNGNIPYYLPYFIVKCGSKIFSKPFLIGAIAQFIGFLYSRFIRKYRPFPEYAAVQVRKEQKNFILSFFNISQKRVI